MYQKMQQALVAKDERISILEKEVEYLKQYIKDKDDKAQRWRQAKQQGEVHEKDDITYRLCEPLLTRQFGIWYNIKLDAFYFN